MTLLCTITLALNIAGVSTFVSEKVESKVLIESYGYFLIDASDGARKFNLSIPAKNYSHIVVNKDRCTK